LCRRASGRTLAASFANGRSREGALVGFSEESYPTPYDSTEGNGQETSCLDRSPDCAGWVASGECQKNSGFMEGDFSR
jgi:hypothetical protein